MSLAAGERLGPYEVGKQLGAGGMGEVYLARDTRLGRTVAIKVLPPSLSSDPEFRRRFAREALAVSSFSHPNVCALYDVGHQDGTDYLVMECLEGETLSARLKKGPLPLDQIVRFGAEICKALEAAHKRGIVHRDLKPGNIFLTKTGAKLLDFGLATLKAGPSADEAGEEQKLTRAGMVLGTLHYLAPEQIEGREADPRTDIFALGVVLYEMSAHQAPFTGKSQSAVMAAIVATEPAPVREIRPELPAALERLIKLCLAKDPDERWQSAHDVGLELQSASAPSSEAARQKTRPRRTGARIAWALIVIVLILAAGAAGFEGSRYWRKPAPSVPWVASVLPPGHAAYDATGLNAGPVAVSPDGRSLAFVASVNGGSSQLWVRPLSSATAHPLAGTEGASYPFWSPDSHSIAFFASRKLKRIDADGGAPQTLCAAPFGQGGSWSQSGQIVFSPSPLGPLQEVSAMGGQPKDVTTANEKTGLSQRWPWFLPDGRHFLFQAGNPRGASSPADGIYIGSLDAGPAQLLLKARSNAIFENGYLLYLQGRTLTAQAFDPRTSTFSGNPERVAQHVAFESGTLHGVFSASANGVLAYQTSPGPSGTQLVWYDPRGNKFTAMDGSLSYYSSEISPNGKALAVDILEPSTGNVDVWLYNLATGLKTRFTFGAFVNMAPVWSPDGRRIAFASNRGGYFDLFAKAVDANSDSKLLYRSAEDKNPTDWSPDGAYLAFDRRSPDGKGQTDIGLLPISGTEHKPVVLLASDADEREAQFCPTGHWIAYTSDETGRDEVYVTSYPQAANRWQVSVAGGESPRWSGDGKTLYFLSPSRLMMAATVIPGASTFQVGAVQPLFSTRASLQLMAAPFAVSKDGKRFLINTVPDPDSTPLMLLVHWPTQLRRIGE
jgi:serine/threonine protein kinase